MYDLIGRPYRLGADGTDPDGAIDCIHLVYTVLDRLGITTPAFDPSWYDAPPRQILKAIHGWGRRVLDPLYDGDVVLLPHKNYAFGTVWQDGILYITASLQAATWHPLTAFPALRCYRSNCSLTSAS